MRYQHPDGATVDLVAVIHVGESSYYEQLNEQLAGYQSVLFEMVLDVSPAEIQRYRMRLLSGREPEPLELEFAGDDVLSLVQQGMADILGLEFQLSQIDYQRKNFYHADLTLKEFERAMAARNQSPSSLLKSLLQGSGKAEQTPAGRARARVSILKVITFGPTPEERAILKAGMAEEFSELGNSLNEMEGQVLLETRNDRALRVLRDRLKLADRHLAIFYGAAHMPDFDAKLKREGWKPVSTTWLDAWKL